MAGAVTTPYRSKPGNSSSGGHVIGRSGLARGGAAAVARRRRRALLRCEGDARDPRRRRRFPCSPSRRRLTSAASSPPLAPPTQIGRTSTSGVARPGSRGAGDRALRDGGPPPAALRAYECSSIAHRGPLAAASALATRGSVGRVHWRSPGSSPTPAPSSPSGRMARRAAGRSLAVALLSARTYLARTRRCSSPRTALRPNVTAQPRRHADGSASLPARSAPSWRACYRSSPGR